MFSCCQRHTKPNTAISSSSAKTPVLTNSIIIRVGSLFSSARGHQKPNKTRRKMRLFSEVILVAIFFSGEAFQPPYTTTASSLRFTASSTTSLSNHPVQESKRRSFLSGGALAIFGGLVLPADAWAGIDVSGLKTDGSGGNSALASQLKAYDGSASTRIKEVKAIQSTSTDDIKASPVLAGVTSDQEPIATWAYRVNPGFNPSLTRSGPFGNLYKLNDMVQAPSGSKRRSLSIQLEFPNDWLQLDRNIGGIQYVDQRNGDKLYVFRAPLPADTTLETLSKSTLGDYIFDPKGSLAKTGQTFEEYKVVSSQILSQCPNTMCATRRRFKVKYATVTGNGLRVERRALVDAYQVENDIYMLMTSSNAIKFDQKDSPQRETVENIANSFQIDA